MNEQDKSYGIILVYRENDKEDEFLILQQLQGHWSFPKGHAEEVETPVETAKRELAEETGILDIELAELQSIKDSYVADLEGKKWDKTVEYFIAFAKNKDIFIQESEIKNYKWATFNEAIDTLNFDGTKNVLRTAQKYLENESTK